MRRLSSLLFLAGLASVAAVSSLGTLPATQAGAKAAKPDDYPAAWDRIARMMRSGYFAKKGRAKELEDRLGRYAPLAKSARTREEFVATVNQMIAEFKDSHFGYFVQGEPGYYSLAGLNPKTDHNFANIGTWFWRKNGGWEVQYTFPDGEGRRIGLTKGDHMVSVGGKPFTPVFAFEPYVGKSVTITWTRNGRVMKADVMPKLDTFGGLFLQGSRDSAKVIEWNGRNYGYYKPYMLSGDPQRTALSAAVYGKLMATDGFVLDLRDGYGGRPEGFADPFFRPGVAIDAASDSGMRENELFGYGKPMVVLINDGTRSAREVLSYILRKAGRAKLVGSQTAGAVLGTMPLQVNDWSYLEEPIVRITLDGRDYERIGVTPDVMAPDEYKDGHDLTLEKGLEVLERETGTSKSN